MVAAALGAQDARERAFRRAVGASLALHLLGAAAFWWSPLPSRDSLLPAVVNVTLVAAAPGAPSPPAAVPEPKPAPPPPKPEAKPEPVPPPPAPKPKPKPEKVLLPKEATKVPKPRPEAKPKPAAKPEPAPRREPVAYDDVLSQLRAEAGESAPEPVKVASRTARAPPGGGLGIPISAEEAAWRRRVRVAVTRSWVLEPGMRRQPLETEVRVSIGAGGEVKSVDVSRKSGNPWYDDSVVRAVEKASPLPAPPEVAQWRFVFTPQDLL